jgi:hypothetical protein
LLLLLLLLQLPTQTPPPASTKNHLVSVSPLWPKAAPAEHQQQQYCQLQRLGATA